MNSEERRQQTNSNQEYKPSTRQTNPPRNLVLFKWPHP
jgi:hypothetical protein